MNSNDTSEKTYLQYLIGNVKKPLIWIGITALFIIYWLLYPDASSAQAIRVVLWTWLALLVVIPSGLFYTYKKHYLNKWK